MSKSILGPFDAYGYCTGDERLDMDTLVWVDFDKPLVSGEVAVLFLDTPVGPRARGKWLHYMPDGRWYAVAQATRDPDDLFAIPLDSPAMRIGGIAAVCRRVETPRAVPRAADSDAENRSPQARKFFEAQGGEAIAYWKQHGFGPPRTMKFETSAENIEAIRSIWCTRQ